MEKPLKMTLRNGLRVILLESHAAPVVSLNLWANVGSVNETDDEAGICHLIEHMIFKGTGRRPVGEIAREVEAAGGDMNAYTNFDETVFYINMASKRMEIGLDILADAASDPTFNEIELTREKEVVVEEISRSDDNPSQMVSLDLFRKVFSVHPYGRPIAGDRETVRGISQKHLMDFFKRWYVGSNLILIVVGDFHTNKIFPRIESLFSKIPAGSPPSAQIPKEPVQKEQRITTRAMDVEGRYFDLSMPIPHMTHEDIPALDLLSHVLGNANSSRLEQITKEKKGLVSAIASYSYSPRHAGTFIVGGVLKEKALHETLQSIWEEIEKLKNEPPTSVEFARARENIRSSRIYEKQTVEALARKLGYSEGIAGDLSFDESYFRKLGELTPEDVQAVAQKYLLPERITFAFCHPQGESWKEEEIQKWLPSAQTKIKKPKDSSNNKKQGDTQKFRLSCGIHLLIRENHHLPLVSLRTASLAGIRYETPKTNGINHLISNLLTKGTISRTAREIAEESEGFSGHVSGYMGRNILGVSGSFLSEKTSEGIELLCDILLHPSFPEDEVRKEKEHTYTSIKNEADSLATVAMQKFLATLYPRHPYGLPTLGTMASVRSLQRGTLVKYHEDVIRPDNLVISVVGDVNAQEMYERLQEKFGKWKTKKHVCPRPLYPKLPSKPATITTKRKKMQGHIIYGFLGTTINNKDRYALEVMNSILAGQGGRLFLELRDKQSLAYAVSSSTHEGIEPGYVSVYMGSDPVKLETAIAGIRLELQKIRESLVSEEEIQRSKRFIIGNYELDLQKNESVATVIAFNEIYKLDGGDLLSYPREIEAVTRQDILRVAKKYLRPEHSILSVIRP